jgi:hypothetical protein
VRIPRRATGGTPFGRLVRRFGKLTAGRLTTGQGRRGYYNSALLHARYKPFFVNALGNTLVFANFEVKIFDRKSIIPRSSLPPPLDSGG